MGFRFLSNGSNDHKNFQAHLLDYNEIGLALFKLFNIYCSWLQKTTVRITTLYNVCLVPWEGVLSALGGRVSWRDIMSTMGRYFEYCGNVRYRGGYHDACGGYHEYHRGCSLPWGIQSFVIWVPPRYWTPLRYSWYSPRYSRYPPSTHDIFTVLNTSHSTQDIPTVLMISPTVLNTPWYWASTVLNTHYTGWQHSSNNCVGLFRRTGFTTFCWFTHC